ncbi:MAG: tellurium resistance protein TerC [Actinomyces ruminicola]|nr:tellurium resistance protein TerC [Actinomyces ruminicola]
MRRSQVWDDATVSIQDVPGMADPGSFGTRRGGNRPIEVGLVDPAWTRLAVAGVVPVLLAVSAALPAWMRLIVVVLLVPLTAQGWPALVRTRHDQGATAVITLTGLAAAVLVAVTNDFGMAGVVMAFSVLAAFVAQMARSDGRKHLVEDLSATVTGNLVMISGAGWCALRTGIADPAVIVPCTLALFTGALLTTLNVRATVLEVLTSTVPALVAGAAGGALARVGFFGASHVGVEPALQSAAACLVTGFVAGVLMAVANRVLWTHRWVPGGRAAVASAIVPILSLGAPVYAIARVMGSFVAG